MSCFGCTTEAPPKEESSDASSVPAAGQETDPKHIVKRTEYEFCTVALDYDLPETGLSYPVYQAALHRFTGAEYAAILNTLGFGQQWTTESGKPFDPEHLSKGSFQAIRQEGTDIPRALFRGSIGGSRFFFTMGTTMETVMGASDLNPDDADDRLLAPTLEKEPEISKEDARNISDLCVSEMGCFAQYRLLSEERAMSVDVRVWETTSDGWRFLYTPAFGDLQMSYSSEWDLWKGPLPVSAAPWTPSPYLSVYVTKQGIESVQCESYADYSEVSAVEIASPENLSAWLEGWAYEHFNEPINNDQNARRVFSVPQVRLVYALLADGTQCNTIPCWEVTFTKTFVQNGNESEPSRYCLHLSAIDGSYAEPRVTRDQINLPDGSGVGFSG